MNQRRSILLSIREPAAVLSCLLLTSVIAAGVVAALPASLREEVRFAASDLRLEEQADGTVVVRYPGAVGSPAGSPDLPLVPVWIEVPSGMRVVGVKSRAQGVAELGVVRVRPVAPDVRVGEAEKAAVADAEVYGSAGPVPGEWAVLASEGTLRGHQLAGVLVSPVRWSPGTGQLERASVVEVELVLEPGRPAGMPEAVERRRVSAAIESKFEADASKWIRGFTPAAATEGGGDAGSGPAGPGPYQPTFRPTTDGSAVEYVVVTSAALAGEFQRLADWKTQKGVQAAVRTVEWIDQTYPNGVDRAERVRFFIRDAYQNWGTMYVLLGGDTDIVPPRYAQMVLFDERIPADYYFACLDGNWNYDGDSRFGESLSGGPPGDQCDLHFEVTVGRVPASTPDQVARFVDKLLLYEQNPPVEARYPASILVLAERLFTTLHGADIAEEALALVPSWIRKVRLYEESASYPGSIELNRQVAVDSINAGFGIVHHVGHGYRNTMSLGSGTMSNGDADNLVNAPRNSVVFAINCSSASIDFNSIGERWVKNANGGSIAYLGTSRLAFVTASRAYQGEWYATVFQDSTRSLGLATDESRAIFIPAAQFDGVQRWNLLATTLLGDPEVDLYTNAVVPLVVTHASTTPIGGAPLSVTVTAGGSPVAGATVTLWKAGESYVRGVTGANGQAQLAVGANTPGAMTVTVHKSYYRPYVGTVTATSASGPYVYVTGLVVDDDNVGQSSGDGDGRADAGETVELRVTLRNGGGGQVTGLVGTISENDPENALTIVQATVSYGTIAPGGSTQGSGAFVVTIAENAPVAYQPVLTVVAAGTQGTWVDPVVLPLRRPYLEHWGHVVDDASPRGNGNGVVEAGEEIYYRVTVKNTGQDGSVGLAGSLRALQVSDRQPHPGVTVGDGASSFGTLTPGQQVEGDRFAFTLSSLTDPTTVLLELTLTDALGVAAVQYIDLTSPSPPGTFSAFGSPGTILLTWERAQASDIRGYDVLRSISPGGPFQRINAYTVDGTAAYEDRGLPALTRYYYQVVSRDSSYNASVPSAVFSGTTNPPAAAGWPQELAQQSSSSAVIADIDGGAHIELLCGSDMMYAWHGDGTEVVDGDDDSRTNGPFSLHGWSTDSFGFASTPAVGDVDGDGDLEVASVGFTSDSLFVWQGNGQLFPGWPKWVMDDLNWGSVVLADLDRDGDLEMIVWAANGGRLFAWHHTGQEVVDGDANPATDGILARVLGTSFNYGSAAVGNLDQDPELEIVAPVNFSQDDTGRVYAFNIDGSMVAGWPFTTGSGTPSEVSSSPVIADLDGDGDEEVIFAAERDYGRLYVLNGNGTVATGWPQNVIALSADARLPSPAVGDVDADGALEIVYADTEGKLFVFERNGALHPGFPLWYYPDPPGEATQSTPVLGDIDGDPELEIVFGDESGVVRGYNADGSLVAGFPIRLTGEVRSSPALWDLDRDGLLEMAVVGFDSQVYVWDLTAEFNPQRLPWPFFRHDTRNTGRFVTAVQPIGIAEPAAAPEVASAAFHGAHPNPFNPTTTLGFDVPGETGGAQMVTLAIYDVGGRLLRQLIDGPIATGSHAVEWDGRTVAGAQVSSGVYFAHITIGDFVATRKLVVVR